MPLLLGQLLVAKVVFRFCFAFFLAFFLETSVPFLILENIEYNNIAQCPGETMCDFF